MSRLIRWREVANVIYLFSDSEKCAQAEALAMTLTAVLQVPALAEPVKYSILFAWAYVESLIHYFIVFFISWNSFQSYPYLF